MSIWPWRKKEIRLTQTAWGRPLKSYACDACGYTDPDYTYCPLCASHSRWPIDSALEFVVPDDPMSDLTPRAEALVCLSAIRDHFTWDDDDKPEVECKECLDRFEIVREFLFSNAQTLAPSPPSVQQNKKESSPPVEEGKEE